ncbi:hypothetical protein ZIOFF_025719 [Zingiber officinale]|uniref:Legume lectin domain-containing protein n=1 Tax=Zingiber officinale TaxID=94328 RepID=A0A8J5LHE1_ZINOF|nr:hypothetical protein ZIOFF_025719 [Zingiber officinale]
MSKAFSTILSRSSFSFFSHFTTIWSANTTPMPSPKRASTDRHQNSEANQLSRSIPNHWRTRIRINHAGFPSSSSLSFNFASFPNDVFVSDILLQGDADNGNGGIELTKDTLIGTVTESGGRASYQKDIFLLWDAQTMQLSDFTTRFVFDIRPQAQTNFTGDSLALFLSVPMLHVPNNSLGGSLGLFTWPPHLPTPPENTTVAVEFDTFSNGEIVNDPAGSHIGIDINSVNSTVTASLVLREEDDSRGGGCEATGCLVKNGMLDGCGVIGEKWNARWSWGYGTLIPDPEALPSMEQAISVLNFEAPSPELPPAIFEYSKEF